MLTKIKKILSGIAEPFIAVAVILDESRRINEDGSWNGYHARRNRKERRKNG